MRWYRILVPLAAAGCATGAEATVYSENDVYAVGNRDRYYTNGLRASFVHAAQDAPDLVREIAEALPEVSREETTQIGWIAGQEMYTPSNTRRDPPNPLDRPYGGWLYAGVLVSKAVRHEDAPAGDRVDVLEVDLGVVGPPSLAERTQISFHHVIDSPRPNGWDHQLRFEPGIVATYEHRRRVLAFPGPLLGGDCDAIGVAGASLGNVFTHGTASAIFRWGTSLPRDFGPNTIHSTAVAVPDEGEAGGLRAYVFGGAAGRAVARNLFLDGNTFRDGPEVDSKTLVGELRAGIVVAWGPLRLGYTHIIRTREFDRQPGRFAYGSVALTWDAEF